MKAPENRNNDFNIEVDENLEYLLRDKFDTIYEPRMEWQGFRDKILWSYVINEFFAERITYLAKFFKDKCEVINGKDCFSLDRARIIFEEISYKVKLQISKGSK